MLNKYRNYIIAILCFLAVGVIGVLVIVPALGLVRDEYEKLTSDQEILRKLTEKANKLSSLNEPEIRSQLAIANSALPAEKESFGIISGLDYLVATAGGRLESYAFTAGPEERILKRSVKMAPFTVTMSGGSYALFDFIDQVYKSLRLMGVENISLIDGVATLKMATYYQALKENLGEIETPLEDLTESDRRGITEVTNYALVTTTPALEPVGKPNLFGP